MAREKMAPTLRRLVATAGDIWGEDGPECAREFRALLAVARAAVRWRLNSKPLDMSEEEFWRNPQLNLPNQGSETLNRAIARLRSLSKKGARE